MLITPAMLLDEPLKLDEAIAPGTIDYAFGVSQVGSLVVEGEADLLVEHRGHKETVDDIRLRGRIVGEFEVQCARCLDPVKQAVNARFDLIFRPASVDAEAGEHAISEDDTEIGYYEESGLPLEDAVREQVLLTLPGRILCQEDCKGLCPVCGVHRNTTDCTCGDTPADPRWKALAGLELPKA